MLGQYIVVLYPLSNQLGMPLLQVQELLFSRCFCFCGVSVSVSVSVSVMFLFLFCGQCKHSFVWYPLSNQLGMLVQQVQELLFARCFCSPTSYIKPPTWSSSVKQFTGIVFNLFSPIHHKKVFDLVICYWQHSLKFQILDHNHQGPTCSLRGQLITFRNDHQRSDSYLHELICNLQQKLIIFRNQFLI